MIVPATIVVNLTDGHEAFGIETSYYGGTIVVGSKSIVIDGKTDRSDTWADAVAEELVAQIGIEGHGDEFWEALVVQINEQMSLENDYIVTYDGESFRIDPGWVALGKIEDEPKATIWRVHAEKIAEDVAIAMESDDLFGESAKFLRDEIIVRVVNVISQTLEMAEDE